MATTSVMIDAPYGVMLFAHVPQAVQRGLAQISLTGVRSMEIKASGFTLYDDKRKTCGGFDRGVIAGWALIGAPPPAS